VDWDRIPAVLVDPMKIPDQVEMKANLPSNRGRPSLLGPGKLEGLDVGMCEWSVKGFATDLTPELVRTFGCIRIWSAVTRNRRAVGSVAAGVPKVLERNPGGGVGSAGTGRVKS
jgi:hypothetical protein